jgi:hypothetical protein
MTEEGRSELQRRSSGNLFVVSLSGGAVLETDRAL